MFRGWQERQVRSIEQFDLCVFRGESRGCGLFQMLGDILCVNVDVEQCWTPFFVNYLLLENIDFITSYTLPHTPLSTSV